METGNQQVDQYPIVYTRDQLIYLVSNFLWGSDGDEEGYLIRKLILSTFNSNVFMSLLPEEYRCSFQMPLENIPLHVNSENSYERVITKWRLGINK